jgi:hypothetical protein
MPEPRGANVNGLHIAGSAGEALAVVSADFYQAKDASAFVGFGFWAQAVEGSALGIGVHTPETYDDDFRGFVLNTDDLASGLTMASNWTYYRVYFEDLQPTGAVTTLNTSEIAEIQFLVSGTLDYWIDDVSFFAE